MINLFLYFIATGFRIGQLPASGTFGTLLGAIIWWFLFSLFSFYLQLFIVFSTFLIGIFICQKCADNLGEKDPSSIVFDEIVGIWLVFLVVFALFPLNEILAIISVLIFRFFDIVKPPPIRWFDKSISGGLGIMIDDIVAALFTVLTILIFYFSFNLIWMQKL